MGVAVGIDLGTTNTVVGAVIDGRAVTLADEGDKRLIPSIVSFHPSGKVLVGDQAKDRRIVDPLNTIYSIKRLIGRTWESQEVQGSLKTFPFALKEGQKHGVTVAARGETYTLPEISAFVLRRAKQVAETALGENVERAVITVPANFNDLQRAATKLAGKLAGLEVLRILNEPTAAALAYGQATADKERIAIYDLGGGTFDVTLLDLADNVYEVLATGGDSSLGGDDVDLLIAGQMAKEIVSKHRDDPRADPTAWATLRARAEIVKMALSTSEQTSIELNDVVRGRGGDFIPFMFSMTRSDIERMAMPLIGRTLDTCQFSLETVGIKLSHLGRLILVGGATRMPMVVRMAEGYFKLKATGRVNPDEVVALGAAIQAHALNRTKSAKTSGKKTRSRMASSAPKPVRSATPLGLPLVTGTKRGNAPADPLAAAMVKPRSPGSYSLVEEEETVDAGWGEASAQAAPSKVTPPVAARAAVPVAVQAPARVPPPAPPPSAPLTLELPHPPPSRRAAPPPPLPPPPPSEPAAIFAAQPEDIVIIEPEELPELPADFPPAQEVPVKPLVLSQRPMKAPLLIDVTPLSLGVEVAGGFTDVLIAANTPVPCDRTRVFRTASDGQVSVVVRVAQGESKKFAENTCLGDLELSGLQAAPRGEVKVAVIFEIDADGILNVRAQDVDSGRVSEAKMRLLGAQTDASEVDQMMSRQERHAIG